MNEEIISNSKNILYNICVNSDIKEKYKILHEYIIEELNFSTNFYDKYSKLYEINYIKKFKCCQKIQNKYDFYKLDKLTNNWIKICDYDLMNIISNKIIKILNIYILLFEDQKNICTSDILQQIINNLSNITFNLQFHISKKIVVRHFKKKLIFNHFNL